MSSEAGASLDVLVHSTAGAALRTWLAMKSELQTQLPAAEWSLWVRPARLLREIGGGLLLALPPSRNIIQAARARLPFLDQAALSRGYRGVGLTRYPSEDEREWIKLEYPKFYVQMLGR